MIPDKNTHKECQDRLDEFNQRLFDRAWFELSQDGETIHVVCRENPDVFCDLTIREWLNQHEFRNKIERVSGLVLPCVEESQYYKYAEMMLGTARCIRGLMDWVRKSYEPQENIPVSQDQQESGLTTVHSN
jgi:hypothetical protein